MEWNASESNEADGEEIGGGIKGGGCSDGPELKNGEGDLRIPLECQTQIRRKPQ
jgi:hypothetical protein